MFFPTSPSPPSGITRSTASLTSRKHTGRRGRRKRHGYGRWATLPRLRDLALLPHRGEGMRPPGSHNMRMRAPTYRPAAVIALLIAGVTAFTGLLFLTWRGALTAASSHSVGF